jgi:hypothetical protein
MSDKVISKSSFIGIATTLSLLFGGFIINVHVRMSNVEEANKVKSEDMRNLADTDLRLAESYRRLDSEAKQDRKDVQAKLDRLIEFHINNNK